MKHIGSLCSQIGVEDSHGVMEDLLHEIARYVALAIEAIAILVIVIGVVEVLIATCRLMLSGRASISKQRTVWLSFAHWLVAGLTLQLTADIVQTTITPSWDEVGRVAAIAAIRTFLTYFLDLNIEAVRELQHGPARGETDARDG
jgi:uncharacterized membrane protein